MAIFGAGMSGVAAAKLCAERGLNYFVFDEGGKGDSTLFSDNEAKKFPIVTKTEKGASLNTVMSNSFGFGGTNAALIFEKV